MSGRARPADNEDAPPAKKVKVEQAQDDDVKVKEEGMEQEAEGDTADDQKSSDGYGMLSQMREEDVGITEYISEHKGISAIIKQRYSDFIVNEISSTGEVVHLTSTDLPVVVEETEPAGPVDSVLPEDFVAQLKQIAAGSNPGATASIPAGEDKEWRLRVHRAVKGAFPKVETKTEERDGKKVIIAMLKVAAKDKRKQPEWPSSKSKFPHCRFVMYKENKGTMDVIHLISRYLKVKDNLFHYAGTKDKRGKTTQAVTAYKIHPKKLQCLNAFLRNITLGNFSYVEKQLRLGELKGNRFTIVLRNVIGDEKDIEKGLKSLKEVGFINYYGLQRFGTLNVPTHHVGRALLQQNFEEAVNLIIAGSSSDNLPFRKLWQETKDPQKTLESLESRHFIERVVLKCLARKPKDFLGALQAVPRNTRLMYPHSYQSEVWNTMASRRIRQFGLKPIMGDLVLPPDGDDSAAAEADVADVADGEEASCVQEEESGDQNKGKGKVRMKPVVLDASNLSQFTIYDVILPLPGYDVMYPKNEIHTWYKEKLEADGFDIDKMERKQKDYSLPGGYRALVVRPKDVEWKSFKYDDPTVSLALSDLDRKNGVEEPQSVEGGKLKALRLSFSLSTSSYATMALREVLKMDTSPAHQASMNVT